jgi:hypothetical protein
VDQRKPHKLMKTLIFSFLLLGFALAGAGFLMVDSLRTAAAGKHSSPYFWDSSFAQGTYVLASADSTATPTPFQPLPPTAFAKIETAAPAITATIEPTAALLAEDLPTATPYLYDVIATETQELTLPLPSIQPTSTLQSPAGSPTATLSGPTTTVVPTPEVMLTAAPELEQLPRQINVLLLGADRRPYEAGFRTDTIILVTVNTELGRVNFTHAIFG